VAERAALALVALLLLTGCGGGGPDERASRPAGRAATPPADVLRGDAPPTLTPAVRARLAQGETAVADFANATLIEPATIQLSSDQRLTGTVWSGWGGRRATGHGTIRTLDCDPSCAQGGVLRGAGTLVLTAPRVCGSRRYYAKAALAFADPPDAAKAGGARPAVYLRTPC
jgi:hypothetical protein